MDLAFVRKYFCKTRILLYIKLTPGPQMEIIDYCLPLFSFLAHTLGLVMGSWGEARKQSQGAARHTSIQQEFGLEWERETKRSQGKSGWTQVQSKARHWSQGNLSCNRQVIGGIKEPARGVQGSKVGEQKHTKREIQGGGRAVTIVGNELVPRGLFKEQECLFRILLDISFGFYFCLFLISVSGIFDLRP